MRSEARAVVIGSGIAGSSIAYHLCALGWSDTVVVEQGELRSGTTSHAPGLVGQLRANRALTSILMYSVRLYAKLRHSGEAGFFPVGSLRLAASRERWQELKRQADLCAAVGLEAELVGPGEVQRLVPIVDARGLWGALHLPSDGSARATVLAGALAEGAAAAGATFLSGARVTGIEVRGGRVRAVSTTQGRIQTDNVVCAAGIWSPAVGQLAGVQIPLTPMRHQYVATAPLSELRGLGTMPNVRDPDRLVYWRQDGESLVVGGYEREPVAFDVESIGSAPDPTVKAFSREQFAELLRSAREVLPCLSQTELARQVCGLESFTPDGEFILGEAAEPRGFWAAAGFCAHGVSGAGGVGKVLAEWIVHGQSDLDLWHMDIRRFAPHATGREFVRARSRETYATYYDIAYPGREKTTCRGLRTSPAYPLLKALGAHFGEKSGWERPEWFTPNARRGIVRPAPTPRGWAQRSWSPAIAAEHEATRGGAAIYDLSSFGKIDVAGPGALRFLQRLAANDVDRPVGSIIHAPFLNDRGGIESDVTVTRLGEDRFRVVTGTAFASHDFAWMRTHVPEDGVALYNATPALACFGVWGPKARDVLLPLAGVDLSNSAFPFLSARETFFGDVPVLAARVSYAGELGWEIYTSSEHGSKLWTQLWEAGRGADLVAAGYRAIDSLRLEKGFRYWSTDISTDTNPWEAGLGYAVALNKGDFHGRDALVRLRQEGERRRLCCMTLDAADVVLLGGEPLVSGGTVVGAVTSAGFGFTVGRSIAYGYLPVELCRPSTRLETRFFGEAVGVTVEAEPLYDPRGERMRA